MLSDNQLAQQAAAKALSMRNSTCYPEGGVKVPLNAGQQNSMPVVPQSEGEMYGR